MAGIGFELRRLVRADTLSSNLGGLAHAVLASSGPWLVSCLSLLAIAWIGRGHVPTSELQRFSILVTYNFSFSLVGVGALVMVVTRLLANALHARDTTGVPDLLMGSLGLVAGGLGLGAWLLYGSMPGLAPVERLLAGAGLVLTGGIWLLAAFLSALKDYAKVSAAFASGMAVALLSSALLVGADREHARVAGPPWPVDAWSGNATVQTWSDLSGLLVAFTLGLAVIVYGLLAQVLAEFRAPVRQPFAWLPTGRSLWRLALTGLFYNLAIWVDKWIMWMAPGATWPGPALVTHEAYEGAMFLAFLSIVPALALLLVELETRFYEHYRAYYRAIAEHAPLAQLLSHHAAIGHVLLVGLRRIVWLQGLVCLFGVLLAPALVTVVQGGVEMVPILRYGLLGALFHMLLIAAMVVLAYFDLQRELLAVATLFCLSNACFSLISVWAGGEYLGHGYLLATILTAALANWLAIDRVARLPYLSFVANNPAVTGLLRK